MAPKDTQEPQSNGVGVRDKFWEAVSLAIYTPVHCANRNASAGQGRKTAWPAREDWHQAQPPTLSAMMLSCFVLGLVKLEAYVQITLPCMVWQELATSVPWSDIWEATGSTQLW